MPIPVFHLYLPIPACKTKKLYFRILTTVFDNKLKSESSILRFGTSCLLITTQQYLVYTKKLNKTERSKCWNFEFILIPLYKGIVGFVILLSFIALSAYWPFQFFLSMGLWNMTQFSISLLMPWPISWGFLGLFSSWTFGYEFAKMSINTKQDLESILLMNKKC